MAYGLAREGRGCGPVGGRDWEAHFLKKEKQNYRT